jgi:predicted Zn-dependent protease
VLKEIDAVADVLDFGPGMCGKGGQNVPAACGQPALRIHRITVGGTARRAERRSGA